MSNVLDTSLARKPAGGVLPRFRDRGQVLTARPKAEAVEHRLLPMSRTSESFVRMKQAVIVLFADMERSGELD